jgi:hypothetical protein
LAKPLAIWSAAFCCLLFTIMVRNGHASKDLTNCYASRLTAHHRKLNARGGPLLPNEELSIWKDSCDEHIKTRRAAG